MRWSTRSFTSNYSSNSGHTTQDRVARDKLGTRWERSTTASGSGPFSLSLSPRVKPHSGEKTRVSRRQPWARGSPSPRATATGAPQTSRGRWTSCLRETSPRPPAVRRGRLPAAPRWWWSSKVGTHLPASFTLFVSWELYASSDDAWLPLDDTTLSTCCVTWISNGYMWSITGTTNRTDVQHLSCDRCLV